MMMTMTTTSTTTARKMAAAASLLPFLLLLLFVVEQVKASDSFEFKIENSMPKGNILDLNFKSRLTLPYGPNLYPNSDEEQKQTSTDQPYKGYGFGMGASEMITYDPIQKYLYSMSDIGYIIIADYINPLQPQITNFSFQTNDPELGNMGICPNEGLLLITLEGTSKLDIYELVNRKTSPNVPQLLKSFDNVPNAKTILTSKDCSTIVIANQNEGDDNTQGSITIFQNITKSNLLLLSSSSQEDSEDNSENKDSSEENTESNTESKKSFIKRTIISLDFDEWDDEYLLRRGLNMPLTKNALEYWDEHSYLSEELDFTYIRQNYRSAIFLEPASLAWNGPYENELLVNLQENNGLLRINMTDLTPVAVAGYGLKDHSLIPVDIQTEDKTCDLKKYSNLFAMRNPDTIQTVKYNDKYYVITANEGSSKDYGDWEEEMESQDLFSKSNFGLKNVIVPTYIFDPQKPNTGHSALFNFDSCKERYMKTSSTSNGNGDGEGDDGEGDGEGDDGEDEDAEEAAEEAAIDAGCVQEIIFSVGSNSIDYESDPANPIFHRMVLFGGRGWSIYELPDNPDDLLKLVFDSADAMESKGCEYYPWSHNAVQEEDNAPADNFPNNSYYKYLVAEEDDDYEGLIEMNDPDEDGCEDQGDGTPGSCPMPETIDDQSGEAGPSIENVILGEACGRLVAAVAAEKSSVAMLFDITDITSPDLIKVFHLSPISQYKSVGLAYNSGELGEIDAESGVFVTKETSPSGKAGILWAGAKSGTVSFWEFECKEEDNNGPSSTGTTTNELTNEGEDDKGIQSSPAAKAGFSNTLVLGNFGMVAIWIVSAFF